MSSSKHFRLMSLPGVIFDEVIPKMYLIDCVQLLLCSKATRKRMECLNWNKLTVCVKAYPSETQVEFSLPQDNSHRYFTWKVTTDQIDKTDVHLHCREHLGDIKLGSLRLNHNSKITAADKIFTIVQETDRFNTLKMIADFLLKGFRGAKLDFDYDLSMFPDLKELLKWETTRKCEKLSLKNGTDEEKAYMLDSVNVTQTIMFHDKCEDGFFHEKLITVPRLYTQEYSQFCKEVFLKRDCEHTEMVNKVPLKSEELIKYIQKWLNGGYSNVKFLLLEPQRRNRVKFMEDILGAFDWKMFGSTGNYFRSYGELLNLAYAYYLERSDGKCFSIIHTFENRLWCFVVRLPLPPYPRYRGTREDKYVGHDEMKVLNMLSPRVFETDAEVLLDQRQEVIY